MVTAGRIDRSASSQALCDLSSSSRLLMYILKVWRTWSPSSLDRMSSTLTWRLLDLSRSKCASSNWWLSLSLLRLKKIRYKNLSQIVLKIRLVKPFIILLTKKTNYSHIHRLYYQWQASIHFNWPIVGRYDVIFYSHYEKQHDWLLNLKIQLFINWIWRQKMT